MESAVWRLQGIDTGGADLILSRIMPWSAGGAVPVLSVSSSFVPTSGALENLLADDDSVCVFAAADVRKPGFYIEFTLPEPAAPWGFRFSGPSADNWPLRHQIVMDGQACSLDMLQWVDGGLTAEPQNPLLFSRLWGEWLTQTTAGSHDWWCCAMSADGRVMLAGEYSSGYLHISTDGWSTWTQQTAAGSRNWRSCAMSADGQVMLAGSSSYLYLSTDGGVTWVEHTALGLGSWYASAMSADGQVMLAGPEGGYLYLSTDGGVTWTQQTAAGSRNWRSCAMSADGQVMLAGSEGSYLYLSTNGGVTWTQQTAAGSRNWRSCAMSADGQVMLAGSSGYLYLSTDGGVTWVEHTALGVGSWYASAMSADGQVVLAGSYVSGYLYLSTDGGVTWTQQTVEGSLKWQCCAMSADGRVMLAGPETNYLQMTLRQPVIYLLPPIRQLLIAPDLVHSNQALLPPQGASPASLLAPTAYDTEHAGHGTIYGTVEQKLTGDATLPLKRRVRLHRSRDGLLVRETWSDENGHYRFDGLSTRYEYDVIAWDHEGQFRSTIANNLKPEVLP